MKFSSGSSFLAGSIVVVAGLIYQVHHQQKLQQTRMHKAVIQDKIKLKQREEQLQQIQNNQTKH